MAHLKTKQICKDAVKKLPYLLRYVPDQYENQQMCDKPVLENGGALKCVSDCYKKQEICNKAVDNYPHALEFVPDWFKTQNMCDKAVYTHLSTIRFVAECYKLKRKCEKAVNGCLFLYLILFPIGMKLKKCVKEFFLKILF